MKPGALGIVGPDPLMNPDGGGLPDILGVGIRKAPLEADGVDHPLIDFIEFIPADAHAGLLQTQNERLARSVIVVLQFVIHVGPEET